MNAQEICARLRALAREELGEDVFCPQKPCALFVCRRTEERSGEHFLVRRLEGGSAVDLTPAGVRLLYSLLPDGASLPEPEGEMAVLVTCASRCLEEEKADSVGEDALFTLHCLALHRRELLTRQLPGILSKKLRCHERPDRLTGLLIANELKRT